MMWLLTLLVFCIDAFWILFKGWSVSIFDVATVVFAVGMLCTPLVFSRYREDLRISTTCQASALLVFFMATASTLSYLVVSTNLPLVDASLAFLDHSLGFNWIGLQAWLQIHPLIQITLNFAYQSGLLQLTFVVLFLGFSARPERLEEFMRLFIVATLLTIVLSGFFPAAGSWKYYRLEQSVDVSVLSHFELLRDGLMRNIPLDHMQGLISIPSLHTVMAVLLVYAMRGTFLFPLFVVLNTALVVSTPVDGGHYLVDILAGGALAMSLIAFKYRHRIFFNATENTGSTNVLGR